MALEGRTFPFRVEAGKVRNRRVSPFPVRSGEGLNGQRAFRLELRERIVMHHSGCMVATTLKMGGFR
jgi:hypothetical protein